MLDEKTLKDDFKFLDKFIINPLAKTEDTDFSELRSTPIIKIDNNTYRIISPLFVLEMIYSGLYWKFKAVNDNLRNDERIKLYDLKTYYFSKKFVLHRVLKEYFGNRYFQKTGDELDAICDGTPDYYVRNSKRVFLFESKGIMIAAKVKQPSDFSMIEEEIKKKLYINQKGKPKAVLQIINNVRNVLTNNLPFETGYKGENAIVY